MDDQRSFKSQNRDRYPTDPPTKEDQMEHYRQCQLKRRFEPEKDGCVIVETRIAWIPEEFAVLEKYIKLRMGEKPVVSENPVEQCLWSSDKKVWEDGWRVTEVYNRAPESEVLSNSQDYKKQREASDI